MRRTIKLLTGALAILTLGLAPGLASRANAYPGERHSCGVAEGYSFEGYANYWSDGVNYNWQSAHGVVWGTGRHSNNINFRLFRTDFVIWGSFSPDSLSDGEWYQVPIGRSIPVFESQFLLFEAVFDKNNASDPRCFTWEQP